MPKRVDAAAQRGEIRDAARRVFARRGVSGTGLAHVAREVGMGRTSLYHYYADKDSLLADLLRETLADESALFRTHLRAEGTAVSRVLALFDACIALFGQWADVGRMLLDFRLRDAEHFRRYFREFRGELARALREGQDSGEIDLDLDPVHASATLFGAIDGLLLQHFLDPKALDLDALRAELRRIVLRTLVR